MSEDTTACITNQVRKYVLSECLAEYVVNTRSWAAWAPIACVRPRFLPFIAIMMVISVVQYPILRYSYFPASGYFGFLPMNLVHAACLSIIFAVNEMSQRVEFLFHLRAKEAVRVAEQKKQELNGMLLAMVAEPVLQRLVAGGTVADVREATVIFSDIAGFTSWSGKQSSPLLIISMLNDMYHRFDGFLEDYHMEKVTTIGDAYWVACGIPTPQEAHTLWAVRFAVQMVRESILLTAKYGFTGVRVGVASGVVYGGIVGQDEVAY